MKKVYRYLCEERLIGWDEVKALYKEFHEKGESFAEWLNACKFENNGEFQEVDKYFSELIDQYNRMDESNDKFDFGGFILIDTVNEYARLAEMTEQEKKALTDKLIAKMN